MTTDKMNGFMVGRMDSIRFGDFGGFSWGVRYFRSGRPVLSATFVRADPVQLDEPGCPVQIEESMLTTAKRKLDAKWQWI